MNITDDGRTLMQDGADQLRTYHIGTKRQDVDERRALEVARCAHSAIMDTATVCKMADLQGTEIRDALREASQAMLRLIASIEGKT